MPYKDIEKNREYQRNWVKLKRAGLPTRITPKPTPESIHTHQLETNRRYRHKKRQYIIEMFGDKCTICGKKRIAIIHRKDGKPHIKFANLSLSGLKKEIQEHGNEYARVCGICHSGIHWAMKYLNLKWEDFPTSEVSLTSGSSTLSVSANYGVMV